MYIIPIDNESYQEYINRIIESRENVKNLEYMERLLHDKLSGKSNPSARKVKCVETNEIFDTATDAAKYYGFSHSDIAACIAGRQKSAGKDKTTGIKLHWIYIE